MPQFEFPFVGSACAASCHATVLAKGHVRSGRPRELFQGHDAFLWTFPYAREYEA